MFSNKKITSALPIVLAMQASLSFANSSVFINEIHYDNSGADQGEAIEIAGPANTDLNNWSIVLYNGSPSQRNVYHTTWLTQTLPDSCGGLGVLTVPIGGIQNGSPDGIALVNHLNQVVEFLSYEGAFEAVDGPAASLSSEDIEVSESSSTPLNYSLQRSGSGTKADDFIWNTAAPATFDSCNHEQFWDNEDSEEPPILDHLIINEVDADTAGTDSLEFIELYDGGKGDTDLSGLVLVLYNGNGDASYRSYDLDGFSTDNNGYFIFGNMDVANVDIIVPDNTIQNGADAVALYRGDAADFPSSTPVTTSNLIDAIVYDTNDNDDVGLLGLLNSDEPQVNEAEAGDKDGHSNQRCENGGGGQRNSSNFLQASPTPGEDNNCPIQSACGRTSTPIHVIQGNGNSSPLNGQNVRVEAVVVADFQHQGLNGFYLQQAEGSEDGDPNTSEGIFVFEGSSNVEVNVGDIVHVSGQVDEFFDLTEITNITSLEVCGTSTIPAPTGVNLPFDSLADAEAIEGMLITFQQDLYVTENYNLGRFGEISLSANSRLYAPTQLVAPGTAATQLQAENNLNRIVLDDYASAQNPDPVIYPAPELSALNTLRGGDSVTNLTGVMGYSFSNYRIYPTTTPQFIATNPRPAAPQLPNIGSLRVASFNVLNYFNGDGQGGGFPTSRGADNASELQRQQDKIVSALVAMEADIIGLVELENDGYGDHSAIANLVTAINAAADNDINYQYVNPGQSTIGSDEITVGFIYNAHSVALEGNAKILSSAIDPQFNDSKNRPALAQSFIELATQGKLTIAVNHFKSKGSSCDDLGDPDTGDGQGNCNITRTHAAQALVNWLATDPTGSGDEDFLIIGDLNAYAMEDPINAIKAAGYQDLGQQYNGQQAYSYVFFGQAGTLDYALANNNLSAQVTAVTEWHINADEPRALDYNEEFKSTNQLNTLYNADPYRASDHDPIVVEFNLTPSYNQVIGTARRDKLRGSDYSDLILGLRSADRIYTGGGSDLLLYFRPRDRGDRIMDFNLQEDKIDLSALLKNIGYKGDNPFDDGLIKFKSWKRNRGSIIWLDPDGRQRKPGRPYIFLKGIHPDDPLLKQSLKF